MKALVLGSEGQIGQYFMAAAGPDVYGFDLANGDQQDLRKPDNPLLAEYMQWADIVYFLAFDVGGSAYLAEQQCRYEYLDNNVKMMHNTFRMLKQYDKPFIFASSQMSNMTTSSYGTMKNLGEFYTRSLGGISARFWNVYGQEHGDAVKFHVITDFINAARDGEIRMRTDGTEKRQFLHGRDSAQALLILGHYAMRREQFFGAPRHVAYDITSFQWVTIREVAELIAYLSPNNVRIIPGKTADITQTLRNQPNARILNYWKPTTSLADGIRSLMEK